MARVVLVNLAMFLLPFLVYAAYTSLTRVDDGMASIWEGLPLLPLALMGTLLVVVTLAATAVLTDKPQGAYEPPSVVDGVVKPGRIK